MAHVKALREKTKLKVEGYCWMVRSLLNLPMPAAHKIDFRAQALRCVYCKSTSLKLARMWYTGGVRVAHETQEPETSALPNLPLSSKIVLEVSGHQVVVIPSPKGVKNGLGALRRTKRAALQRSAVRGVQQGCDHKCGECSKAVITSAGSAARL